MKCRNDSDWKAGFNLLVKILNCLQSLLDEDAALLLRVAIGEIIADAVEQFATSHQLHDEVHLLIVLKNVLRRLHETEPNWEISSHTSKLTILGCLTFMRIFTSVFRLATFTSMLFLSMIFTATCVPSLILTPNFTVLNDPGKEGNGWGILGSLGGWSQRWTT